MASFITFLVIVSAAAVAFGLTMGVVAGAAKAPINLSRHPIILFLVVRRNPLWNFILAIAIWGGTFYVVPKLAFAALGFSDDVVYFVGFGVQLLVWFIAWLIGERIWPLFVKQNNAV